MKRIIHVQTKKIVSHDSVGNPIVETSLVKLIDQPEYLSQLNRSSFAKFMKYLNANRYKENPVIIKVVDFKTRQELDKEDYQNAVDVKRAEAKSKKKIDYKKLAENQELEIKRMKIDFEERLRDLEAKSKKQIEQDVPKPKAPIVEKEDIEPELEKSNSESSKKTSIEDNRTLLKEKADELNITYRGNIGNAKLLEKIQEIEPEFKID